MVLSALGENMNGLNGLNLCLDSCNKKKNTLDLKTDKQQVNSSYFCRLEVQDQDLNRNGMLRVLDLIIDGTLMLYLHVTKGSKRK